MICKRRRRRGEMFYLSTPSARVGDMSAASMACRAAPALLRLASSSHEPRRRIVAYAKGTAKRDASSGLLSGVHPDSVTAVASIAERAQAASDRWGSEVTEFLDPALAADACVVIDRMADCEARPWGGYDRAERVRLILGRSEVLDGDGDDSFAALTNVSDGCVALLQVSGNFMFDAADHRDFLGATLGAGIERKTVGDVLVQGERGAQILVTPTMATYLSTAMSSVRKVPVTATRSSLTELRVPPPRVDSFSSIEKSMRLDAVASAGFRMSRSKMSDLIGSGSVKVNWREGCKPKTAVESGDVISLRGKGRVEVGEVTTTKKGSFNVQLTRYL